MANGVGSEQTIDLAIAKDRNTVEIFLAQLDTSNGSETFNYKRFRGICAKLFESDELNIHEEKIREIFRLFDADDDGVLKERERNTFLDWLRVTLSPVNVLLIVDVQNDFIDGSLALRGCGCGHDGADVVAPINHLIKKGSWHKIVYSLDWHPENHISFYENLHLRELHLESKITKEKAKPFDTVLFSEPRVEQKLWPKHCVRNTWGAELHRDLVIEPNSEQVRKGQNSELEAYSVFFDNNTKGSTELQNILSKTRATHIYVCGLAYDVCVKATCLDGLRLGYALAVIDDCCRGVDPDGVELTKSLISTNGGLITNREGVLSLVNEGKRSLVMALQSARALISYSNRTKC